jgi:hypothetical protein
MEPETPRSLYEKRLAEARVYNHGTYQAPWDETRSVFREAWIKLCESELVEPEGRDALTRDDLLRQNDTLRWLMSETVGLMREAHPSFARHITAILAGRPEVEDAQCHCEQYQETLDSWRLRISKRLGIAIDDSDNNFHWAVLLLGALDSQDALTARLTEKLAAAEDFRTRNNT